MADVTNVVEDKKQEYFNSVAVLKKYPNAKRINLAGAEEWTSDDVNTENAEGMRLVISSQHPGIVGGGKVYLYCTVKRPKRPRIRIYAAQAYKLTNKHIEALVNDVAGKKAIEALKRALACQEVPQKKFGGLRTSA